MKNLNELEKQLADIQKQISLLKANGDVISKLKRLNIKIADRGDLYYEEDIEVRGNLILFSMPCANSDWAFSVFKLIAIFCKTYSHAFPRFEDNYSPRVIVVEYNPI